MDKLKKGLIKTQVGGFFCLVSLPPALFHSRLLLGLLGHLTGVFTDRVGGPGSLRLKVGNHEQNLYYQNKLLKYMLVTSG